jgi:DnaK suppressor protein
MTWENAMLTQEQLLATSEDDYMNEAQLEFFRDLLKTQAAEVRESLQSAREQLASFENEPDELDKASIEEERRMSLRFLDRQTKLLPKIDQSIKRIDEGEFGYCEVTGEAIGIKRLLLRPTATLCAEEKQRQEMKERNYRDA